MADKDSSGKSKTRRMVFRAVKATVKAVLFFAVYLVLWQFIAPVSQFVPGLQQMVEAFVTVYICLMIIGDLTAGTIYQHFFNAAKSLFLIAYLMLSLGGGVFSLDIENVSLMIDLRFVLMISMLLGLLGFTKSVLQAITFMSEKAEPKSI